MRSKLFAAITAAAAVVYMLPMEAAAAEDTAVLQYYLGERDITMFISGEETDDLSVMIAGRECKAEKLGSAVNSGRFETVFLVDASESVQVYSDTISQFLEACIRQKKPGEVMSIGRFDKNNKPYYYSISDDKLDLIDAVGEIKYDFASTHIYDNLHNTIDTLYSTDEYIYRRIVLITDGGENSSRGLKCDDLITEIENSPVPIFTLNLQDATKSNSEALKEVARLSVRSNAKEMRVTFGANGESFAHYLDEDINNVWCINVQPPLDLLDGSKKAMEIKAGGKSNYFDIRMPMIDMSTIDEELPETEPVEEEKKEKEEEKSFFEENKILIFGGGAVFLAIIAAVLIAVLTRKPKQAPQPVEAPPVQLPMGNNDRTEFIDGRRTGETLMLFAGGNASMGCVILRDVADSMRIFEVPLTPEGAVIGRSGDYSNIVIDYDRSISRKHCRIFERGGSVFIQDLSSGNKTYVNNAEIPTESVINNGDEIMIGRTRLKVTIK